MDLCWSAEDDAFRAELRAFLDSVASREASAGARVLRMFSEDPDDAASVAEQQRWQRTLAEGGWGAPAWPREYGGRGATVSQAVIFNEELARYDIPSLDLYLVGLGMVGPTMFAHANDLQKRRWLPPLVRGDEIWCQLWSEPDAGSDLASLRTHARLDDDEWVLNGQKVWTTGAHHARWGLCLTRTDRGAPKHAGLSVFVVDMTSPGVTVRPLRQITGGAEFNEVFFDDVRVPGDQLVGAVNDGWRIATTTLMNERYAAGAGDATAIVEPLIALATTTRDGSGCTAFEVPTLRDEVVRAYVLAKVVTLTGYRCLTALSRGQQPGPEGSVLKLARTDLMLDIAATGRRVLGIRSQLRGNAAPDEGLWATACVSLLGAKIGGGTDEIMRNVIGERVLGLPREPRSADGSGLAGTERR